MLLPLSTHYIHDSDIKKLELKANEIRQSIIEMLVEAGSGHSAGPLGMADIFTALYFYSLNHDPKNPDKPDRDRLILSNGHIVPVRYATMAHAGYFSIEELKTLRKFGSRLQGHPERMRLPGLETTSGPLGSGLGQSCGIAYGAKMDKAQFRVYCLMSDGEQEAGNTWESAMFAGKNNLHNITAIIDRNNIQIDGFVEDVMPLEPLADKYRAFGWDVLEINGHDFHEIVNAIEQSKINTVKPTCIIARTIPGKGVNYMEYDYRWHGDPPGKRETERTPPKKEQAKEALKQLRTLHGKIISEHE